MDDIRDGVAACADLQWMKPADIADQSRAEIAKR